MPCLLGDQIDDSPKSLGTATLNTVRDGVEDLDRKYRFRPDGPQSLWIDFGNGIRAGSRWTDDFSVKDERNTAPVRALVTHKNARCVGNDTVRAPVTTWERILLNDAGYRLRDGNGPARRRRTPNLGDCSKNDEGTRMLHARLCFAA